MTGFWAGSIGDTGNVRSMDLMCDNNGRVVVSAKARGALIATLRGLCRLVLGIGVNGGVVVPGSWGEGRV